MKKASQSSKIYIVIKEVLAKSINEAIKNERNSSIVSVYLDKNQNNISSEEIIGFKHEQHSSEQ